MQEPKIIFSLFMEWVINSHSNRALSKNQHFMKLFTKYSRVNILASILALLLGSIGYYFVIRSVLLHQLDDTLKIEEAEILSFVKTRDRLPEPANYRDQKIGFLPAQTTVPRKFINTTRLDEHHHKNRLYRELLFSVMAEGRLDRKSVV